MKLLGYLLQEKDISDFIDREVVTLNRSKQAPIILLIDTSYEMCVYEDLLKKSVECLYDEIFADNL